MARTQWLSEGAEELALEAKGKDGFHCDVAVVGSGYGGAVAAARLAGRRDTHGGVSRVWVLERGHEFVPGAFPERFADLIGQARVTWGEEPRTSGRPEGLFDLRLGSDVSALLGNGLGGGSLINAGVLARPLESVFREPWPSGLGAKALARHFSLAERRLGATKVPDRPVKLQALEALAAAMALSPADRRASIAVTFARGPSSAGVAQHACIGCGDCFTGCNHGAKNSLPMNYLAAARRRGARLFTGVTVLSLSGNDRDGWALDYRFTDRQIAKRFAEVPPKLHARRVILAAGAYGSTGILMRSRDQGLPLSSRRLGKRFSTNGDMIAAGYRMPHDVRASAREETPPWKRRIGPTITGMIDLRTGRVPLAIEELAIPAALRRPFEEVVTTSALLHDLTRRDRTEHRATGGGVDSAAVDPALIDCTAVYATMGDDGAAGEISRTGRAEPVAEHLRLDDDMRVRWEGVAEHEVFREAIRVLEKAHAKGETLLLPNPMWRALPSAIGGILADGQIGGSVLTVHPLGGCAMAERGAEGVVNRWGQVFTDGAGSRVYETLAVLDGAIVPTALEINPCLTIAALAEHAVGKLRGRWGLAPCRSARTALEPLPLPPRLRWPRLRWAASVPTAIRLAERLYGELKLRSAPWRRARRLEAQLEIKYDEIPNLEAFLADPAKSMPLKGRLHLRAGAWSDSVEVTGVLRPFRREPTTQWGRILGAGAAWLRNRGFRELVGWGIASVARFLRGERAKETLCEYVRNWLAVASRVGEIRRLTYELDVRRDIRFGPGGARLLAAGDQLVGVKRIGYFPALPWIAGRWPSPWDQLTRLPMKLRRQGRGGEAEIGALEVDLPYFVKQYATQLQITGQENQPRAIADLLSFLSYVVRLVGKIHLWSFRAPEYPDPYPEYEFREPFNAPALEAARRAAFSARVTLEPRVECRLPGYVPGLDRSALEVIVREAGAPRPEEPETRFRLTRYEARTLRHDPPLQPVLLIHGLGASGNTFTLPTLGECMVKHLADRGFDPWVLDLRTSIGLSCSKRDWSFDDVAFGDIPEAIRIVRQRTGAEKVDVLAHCIGAAMFSMAALGGKLPKGAVGKVVLSQAGPLMELPPANRFRGYLASYFKHYLQIDEFDTTASLTRFNRFIDRILAAYPYPRHEWREHIALFPGLLEHEAYCLRTYGIYGRLFEHANLGRRTLKHLGDTIGHVRYKTYQQTIFYATMRRLTDRFGKNVFVTPENIERYFRFPVCFLHGARNEVFDARTSRRSFELLASIFAWPDLDPGARKDATPREYGPYSQGRRLRLVEVPRYGHQDCMIGTRAHVDVYPRIVAFLRQALDPAEKPRNQARVFVVRPPRMGPILGWLRRKKGALWARIVLVPNDSRSRARYALTFAVRDGVRVPGSARFHRLRGPRHSGPPVRMLDVRLPDGPGDLRVVVLTVHRELYAQQFRSGEAPADDPFGEELERVLPEGTLLPQDAAAAVGWTGKRIDPLLDPIIQACRDLDVDGAPMPPGREVSDPGYARPADSALLSARVREAADVGESVCFALASCRYASTAMDREQADRKFGRLLDLLDRPRVARAPQFLFLAGDTIYADATYGIFDPTAEDERYDQRYFEAWTAPNAREVLRRLPVYPMLDDHEVEENFEGMPDADPAKAGIRAFEAFQVLLTPRGRIGERRDYWYALREGGFDFFVADTRTARQRGQGAASMDATVGLRQMTVLKRWLAKAAVAEPHKPKFIVSPSVVAPWSKETRGHRARALRSDSWDGFPDSLHELLDFIAVHRIRNVVFLSGDYHCSAYCRISLRKGAAAPVTAHSIVSSGLYSPYPFANARAEDLELCFRGTHREWLGGGNPPCCAKHGDLEIDYVAKPMADCASFAVVAVERRGAALWMTFRFDEGQLPVEVRLS